MYRREELELIDSNIRLFENAISAIQRQNQWDRRKFLNSLFEKNTNRFPILPNLVYLSKDPYYEDLAIELISMGAEVNIPIELPYYGMHDLNLMHIAVQEESFPLINLILSIDFEQIYQTNLEGLTPLDLAPGDIFNLLKTRLEEYEGDSYLETPIKNPSGIPQWTNVACYPKYNWLANATVQLQWADLSQVYSIEQNVSQKRWGSGFMISDTLMLTAGHCFDPINDTKVWYLRNKVDGTALNSFEFIPLMKVIFNYQYDICDNSKNYTRTPTLEQTQERSLKRLVEYRCGNLDYAILELDKPSPIQKVALCTDLPKKEDEVLVVQHPAGLDKKIDLGNICDVSKNKISYKLDTEGGSSGSPVGLDKIQAVVAVHTNGTGGESCNSGVSIAAIKAVSKTLRNSNYGFIFKSIPQEKKPVENNKLQTAPRKKYYLTDNQNEERSTTVNRRW